jgi:hypothetical protein
MRTSKIALLHITKTGGTALGSVIFEQTKADETFFFSFFGLDSSRGANRLVSERLRTGDAQHQALLQNRHFLQSRVIAGHFSYDLRHILEGFDLAFATVLREPVERCISNIYQYTVDMPNMRRFGEIAVPSKENAPEAYWRAICSILEQFRGKPIPGLLPHESMMLQNGMCHVLGGTPLHTYSPTADIDRAVRNLSETEFGFFEDFNESCGLMMRRLGLPVVLDERTNPNGVKHPPSHFAHARNYGAPDEVVELVRAMNRGDLDLYRAAKELARERQSVRSNEPARSESPRPVAPQRAERDRPLPVRSPVTFVTAIYRRRSDDALGGRDRPLAFYFDSMQRLAHFGAAWVIYTDPEQAADVKAFADSLAVPVDVVPRALELVPRFSRIQALREALGVRFKVYRDRCHVLCFAKPAWVAAEAAAPRFGSEFVYWIDAGLAHEGLFPRRLRQHPAVVFDPVSLWALQQYPRFTVLAHPLAGSLQHDVDVVDMSAVAQVTTRPTRHVVGGLFGGRREHVLPFAVKFDALHERLLAAGMLGTEENVLTLMATDRDCFSVVDFDTWHHEDIDFAQPAPGQIPFHLLFECWARPLGAPAPPLTA